MNPPDISIIGAGALGTALAGLLQSLGFRACLLGRTELVLEEREIDLGAGASLQYRPPLGPYKNKAEALVQSEMIFLCTKAYDLRAALEDLVKVGVASKAVIISLCNGDILPELARFEHLSLRPGLTDIGCTKLGEQRFRSLNLRSGTLRWGTSRRLHGTSDISIHPGESGPMLAIPNVQRVADIDPFLAKKWVFNASLNSVCAAFGLKKNALALLEHEALLRTACNEAGELARAKIFLGTLLPSASELWTELRALIARTSENENSMAADRRLGRETESSFLAGRALSEEGYETLKYLHGMCINRI